MSASVVEFSVSLVVEECCECHMQWAMPRWLQRDRLRDRKLFYCPAGHAQRYTGKTEEAKLRAQLEAKDRELARAADRERHARADARQEQRRAAAFKGHLTRTKKRVAAGVCPCCKRSFDNLRRHMQDRHPGYVEASDED